MPNAAIIAAATSTGATCTGKGPSRSRYNKYRCSAWGRCGPGYAMRDPPAAYAAILLHHLPATWPAAKVRVLLFQTGITGVYDILMQPVALTNSAGLTAAHRSSKQTPWLAKHTCGRITSIVGCSSCRPGCHGGG